MASNTENTENTRSSPWALVPPALALAMSEFQRPSLISAEIRNEVEARSREVESELGPDQQKPPAGSQEEPWVGLPFRVDPALMERQKILLEKEIVAVKQKARILQPTRGRRRIDTEPKLSIPDGRRRPVAAAAAEEEAI
ncbi:hypothetical protein GGR50DRAFT_698958 [Xylaria sp. CBS 124048]|nr:hypothetical protein GGR50DRAFT_698958 [Xylaria sp. CBS 124048]